MIPKIIKTDPEYDEWCEQEIINCYKSAAEMDEFMFGDYNYLEEWMNDETKNQ